MLWNFLNFNSNFNSFKFKSFLVDIIGYSLIKFVVFRLAGMDGSLDAVLGDGVHQIQISQLQGLSSIKLENGQLTLKIPEQCPFGIRIRAKSLTLPEVMKEVATKHNDEYTVLEYNQEQSSTIDINAENSQVVVQFEDWLASLGFNWK